MKYFNFRSLFLMVLFSLLMGCSGIKIIPEQAPEVDFSSIKERYNIGLVINDGFQGEYGDLRTPGQIRGIYRAFITSGEFSGIYLNNPNTDYYFDIKYKEDSKTEGATALFLLQALTLFLIPVKYETYIVMSTTVYTVCGEPKEYTHRIDRESYNHLFVNHQDRYDQEFKVLVSHLLKDVRRDQLLSVCQVQAN